MTLRLSRVAVAMLCCLLPVATSASAECAWVAEAQSNVYVEPSASLVNQNS